MMTILVTGATGFVGSEIIKKLHKERVSVIGTARNSKKVEFDFDIEIRPYDFEQPQDYAALLSGVDTICHAASWATMWGHEKEEYEKYYLPTKQLMEEAKARGVARFILTSTIAVNEKSQSNLIDNKPGKKCNIWPHLDYLIDLESYMSELSGDDFQVVSLRLGHFIGSGNTLGLIPVLLPRLKTYIVPWISQGKSKVPLIGPKDIAQSFFLTATRTLPNNDMKINVVSNNSPTMNELLNFIGNQFNYPKPIFSVPYWAAYLFGLACEKIANLSGTTPFLSRSLVHLTENWESNNQYIEQEFGYQSIDHWKTVITEHIHFLQDRGLNFKLKNT